MRSVAPLPSKVEHEEGEPAYALLVRALAHNGSRRIGKSIDRMTGARELAPSRWDPTEIARICKADPAAVRHATPDVGSKVTEVMGQTLSADHVAIRARRWCPACMKARPYHRVWWDILPVTSCPEHGIELTSSCGCEGRILQWRSGPLRHCPAGHPLEAVDCPEAEPDVLAFDAYVIGRIRGDAGVRLRAFDDVALGEFITICERLGKASFDEGARFYELRKSYDTGRLHAEGFRILSGLPLTFDELLGRLRIGAALRSSCQFRRTYGALYGFVRKMSAHSVGSALQSILADHVRRNLSARSGMRVDGRTPLVADRIVSNVAADALGILHERLMDLLNRLGIPWERRSGAFEMSMADFEALRTRLDGSRSLKQVGDALRLPSAEVAGLATGGMIDLIVTGQGSAGWIFPANAAAELLSSLRARTGEPGPVPERFVSLPLVARRLGVSVAEALPHVLDGSVEVRARWSRRRGIAGFCVDQADLAPHVVSGNDVGVSLAVAAHRLGLTQKTMDAAVSASLLSTEMSDGVRRVAVEEVERFRATWATMPELRRAMGATIWLEVAATLNRAGVDSPLSARKLRERVYPREAAMRACTSAASSRQGPSNGVRGQQSLAAAMNLHHLMVYQIIEAGLIPTGEDDTPDIIPDREIERFKAAYVTMPELAAAFGLSNARVVLSVLDKAGVQAACRRPEFHSYLFPRCEAFDALRAWSLTEEATGVSPTSPDDPLLAVRDVAARLATSREMVQRLVSHNLLASTSRGRTSMVPASEVDRFSRRYVFANEIARLAGRPQGQGIGPSITKVLVRNGVRPVCSRPEFPSFVFDRHDAVEAIERLGMS